MRVQTLDSFFACFSARFSFSDFCGCFLVSFFFSWPFMLGSYGQWTTEPKMRQSGAMRKGEGAGFCRLRETLDSGVMSTGSTLLDSPARNTIVTVIPSLRYRDALAMIDWLCKAFGFEKHAVYADGNTVHHAQLTFGHGMIMLGSVDNDSAWGQRIVQPDEIVDELETKDYGGSGYSARDPEGHLWSFGDYDPWAEHAA
jgi:uncharacterized glyoxalase superfamily protein PhnB